MKENNPPKSHKYLLWPLAILLFLTLGVFLTTREVPKSQNIRSRAQQADIIQPTAVPDKPGVILNFAFLMPGISSQSGNLKPLHIIRPVAINFYDPDANSLDTKIKPLYSIKATASFDSDPSSPTYTSFVVANLDLNKACREQSICIPLGKYQIAFKTDQALQALIKEKPTDIGGKIFELNKDTVISLPPQLVFAGDFIPSPQGDNNIDIADYSAFINCFGQKADTDSCVAKNGADFDDNGVVDGVDYNLMLLGLKHLITLGFPSITISKIPTISPKPVVVITKVPSAQPVSQGQNNGIGIFITIAVFILILSAAIYWFKKIRKAGEKEYYVKKKSEDEGKTGVWLTLADDAGQTLGHYNKKDVKDGFARIKGITKTENGKTFIEISEIIWED